MAVALVDYSLPVETRAIIVGLVSKIPKADEAFETVFGCWRCLEEKRRSLGGFRLPPRKPAPCTTFHTKGQDQVTVCELILSTSSC